MNRSAAESSEASQAAVAGAFVSRPHRFAVAARLADGSRVEAHLPDPGRLTDLLIPGAELRLRPAEPGSKRRTRYTACLVRRGSIWVSLEASRANALAGRLLGSGRLASLAPAGSVVRSEVRHGRGRFDFRVEPAHGLPLWLEVKSVTLAEGRCGRFPDAPTARGRRHVEELAAIARGGEARAALLFVAQRGDVRTIRPCARIDPAFADALADARRAGVLLRGRRFSFDDAGRATDLGPCRVRL